MLVRLQCGTRRPLVFFSVLQSAKATRGSHHSDSDEAGEQVFHPSMTVHFRCAFEIRPSEPDPEAWSMLVKTVRKWVSEAPSGNPPTVDEEFWGIGFFVGGMRWTKDWHTVWTKRLVGDGDNRDPQYWAMRYEHPSNEPRTWRTDIGITRIESGTYCFSIVVSHYPRSGYFGELPPPPLPNSPNIVKKLVSSQFWRCSAGASELSDRPTTLTASDAIGIESVLTDETRKSPVILVSRDFDGNNVFDVWSLQRNLVGAASVYEFDCGDSQKAINARFMRDFACRTGMVRVYLPPVRFSQSLNARRHRFISEERIKSDPTAVMASVLQGVMHWDTQLARGSVTSVEDVDRVATRQRLNEYKQGSLNRGELDKLLDEVAEENSSYREANEELEAALSDALVENEVLRDESQDKDAALQAQETSTKYLLEDANRRARDAEDALAASATKLRTIAEFSLPESKREVLELVSRLFPDKIGFTARAFSSANDATASKEEIHHALMDMVNHLHPLVFSDDSVDVRQEFKARCGREVALTELGTTRNDSTLMGERNDKYEKTDIFCEPHVKVDKNTTRLYYDQYESDRQQLLVVGKVGHMSTSGTRRRH